MSDYRPERLARLRASLAHAELDGLLVTSLPNIRYLTGFSGSNGQVLVTASELILLTDFRYASQVKHEVGDFAQVIIEPLSLWTRLWAELKQRPSLEVLAFETAHLTHQDSAKFTDPTGEGSRWKWRPALNLVEVLRESKDAGEVAATREAVRIAEVALERTLPQIRVGLTELEVAGILEYELRRAGSEGFPFETIIAAGPRSALPHARASSHVIEQGELLLIDFGAVYAGYCSDITRTFVMGRSTDRQREIHTIVREANQTASAAVRGGMRGRDADALSRGYIERFGYGEAFGHSLGHGIGLEIHEAPRLAKTAEAVLPAGAIVTIEPGIYLEGWGGVRVEDDVVLSSSGAEVLTSFPRELREI